MHVLRYASAVLVAVLTTASVHAQVGEQPIRIVFNSAAGSAGDALVRHLAEFMHASPLVRSSLRTR